jgi:hypothetical protein
MLRSVLSVIAGIAVLTATSFAIEAVIKAIAGPTALSTNHWVRTLTFVYGLMCVAAGGYVAARIARRLPIKHAAAMGVAQAGLTIMAMLSPEANHASRSQWITIAILSIPAAVIGGALYNHGESLQGRKRVANRQPVPNNS